MSTTTFFVVPDFLKDIAFECKMALDSVVSRTSKATTETVTFVYTIIDRMIEIGFAFDVCFYPDGDGSEQVFKVAEFEYLKVVLMQNLLNDRELKLSCDQLKNTTENELILLIKNSLSFLQKASQS